MIESIIGITGSGGYEVPPSEKAPHEARLLKLDISKANAQLKWRPALSFEETVAFTVDGYLAELIPSETLYEQRVTQIKSYIQKVLKNKSKPGEEAEIILAINPSQKNNELSEEESFYAANNNQIIEDDKNEDQIWSKYL